MIEGNKDTLREIRREVSRLARTEQEVKDILWMIVRSDWEDIFTHDLVKCHECNQVIQHRYAHKNESGYSLYYCEKCWQEEVWHICSRCWDRFSARKLVRTDRCLTCLSGICAVCKQMTLPLEYTPRWPRVICKACLKSLGLRTDWEDRELRKLSAHRTRFQVGDISLREWVMTLTDHAWLCAYCRNRPYEQIDHFIPFCKKGMHAIMNCVPACKICNDKKGQKLPHQVTDIPQEDIRRVEIYLQGRL